MSNSESIIWTTLTGVYLSVAYIGYQYKVCFPWTKTRVDGVMRLCFAGFTVSVAIAAIVYFAQQIRDSNDRNVLRAGFFLAFLLLSTALILYYMYRKSYLEELQKINSNDERNTAETFGYDVDEIFNQENGTVYDEPSRVTLFGVVATVLLVCLWTTIAFSGSVAPEGSGATDTDQKITWWGITNIVVSWVSFLALCVALIRIRKTKHAFTFWDDHKTALTFSRKDETVMLARPIFMLIPTDLVTVLNISVVSTLFVFYRDYAQVFFSIMLLIVFPQFGSAFHGTTAAWMEHFQFGLLIWAQMFWMFPALFQRGKSVQNFSAANATAADVHLLFPSDDTNTAMRFRDHWGTNTTGLPFAHVRPLQITLSVAQLSLLPLMLIYIGFVIREARYGSRKIKAVSSTAGLTKTKV